MIQNKEDYKFFGGDIVKFTCSSGVLYFKVVKDPDNFFTFDYDELDPWEVFENTINRCWDGDKLKKIKTKYANNIFKYYLFKIKLINF